MEGAQWEAELDARHDRTRVRSQIDEHVGSKTFEGLTYLELTLLNVRWLQTISELWIRHAKWHLPSWRP